MKRKIYSVVAALLLCTAYASAQNIVIRNNNEIIASWDQTQTANAMIMALQNQRTRQTNGIFGDTIYVSGTITASAMWRMNEPNDADRVYIIKGEGRGSTVLQYMTDAEYDNGDIPNKSDGGLWMYCDAGAEVHISDLTIKNYRDEDKAAALLMAGSDGKLFLDNVQFERIETPTTGSGGVQCVSTGTIEINNCVFDGLVGKQGSALHAYANNPSITMGIKVTNTVFKNNIGMEKNAACQFWSNHESASVDVEMSRCVFYNNLAMEYGASSINFSSTNTSVRLFNNTFAGGMMPAINFQTQIASANIQNNLIYGSTNAAGSDTTDFNVNIIKDVAEVDSAWACSFSGANLLLHNNFIESLDNTYSIKGATMLGTSVPVNCILNTPDDKLPAEPVNDQFIPAAGSLVIDAGVVNSPITDGFIGDAPDIGAYEVDMSTFIWDTEKSLSELKVYPNPTSSVINIEGTDEIKNVSLIDITGSTIKKVVVNSYQTVLDISVVTNGIYFVTAEYTNGRTSIIKIVKR